MKLIAIAIIPSKYPAPLLSIPFSNCISVGSRLPLTWDPPFPNTFYHVDPSNRPQKEHPTLPPFFNFFYFKTLSYPTSYCYFRFNSSLHYHKQIMGSLPHITNKNKNTSRWVTLYYLHKLRFV